MKIIRRERLDNSDVRHLCIERHYFTVGSCFEYEELFRMCDKYDGSTESLQKIAEHIINYSSSEAFDPYWEYDYEDKVCSVMFDLIRHCSYSSFVTEDEND